LYYNDPQIVLLRPQQIQPSRALTAEALDIEMNRSTEWDRLIAAGPAPGSLQYHEPQRLRLASFDAKSPLGRDKTYTVLASQSSPSQALNRRRFAHSLATLDSQSLFDGGWMLPLGQEEAISDWVAAYRKLPAGKFTTVPNCPQPLTVRTGQTTAGTIVYFVNDSRWDITVQTQTNAPAGAVPLELAGKHASNQAGANWTVELGPYDLAVFQIEATNVQLFSPQVDMGQARPALVAAVEDLKRRRMVLQSPPLLPALPNAGFEMPAVGNQIPGWTVTAGGEIKIDTNNPHAGNQSLRFSSGAGWTTLHSEPFAVPKTGRIAVSVWLRVDNAANQPEMRLAVEGLPPGRQFYRGGSAGAGTGTLIPAQWKQIVFPVDDLPPEGLQQLRFRVDLAGGSSVYLDDVELSDLMFTNSELIQLSKIIALEDFQLNGNQLGDCQYELDGYWPRFLKANVPLPAPIAAAPRPADSPPPDKSASKPGVVDRVKDLFKL
jgi:hypothetical protein